MPANASLQSTIDMTRSEDIRMVIGYAALIDKYFKAGNFALKYYSNRPDCYISFSSNTGRSPFSSLAFLAKKYPELAKADSSQTVFCWLSAPDDASTWMLFPDNKCLLTYHSVSTPDGKTLPIYPPQDPNLNWAMRSNTWCLFDGTGKVLEEGRSFR